MFCFQKKITICALSACRRVQKSQAPDWNSFLVDLHYGGLGRPIALHRHLNSHF